jgi:hypothetical protein
MNLKEKLESDLPDAVLNDIRECAEECRTEYDERGSITWKG